MHNFSKTDLLLTVQTKRNRAEYAYNILLKHVTWLVTTAPMAKPKSYLVRPELDFTKIVGALIYIVVDAKG